jgi:hypothetical protein
MLRTIPRLSLTLAACLVGHAVAPHALGFGLKPPKEFGFDKRPNYTYLRGKSKVVVDKATGRHVLVNDSAYDVFAMFVEVKTDLKLTVSAARAGRTNPKLGLVCLPVSRDHKVLSKGSVNVGWNRRLDQDVFRDEVFRLPLAKLRNDSGVIYVMFYRSNRQGTLKLGRIRIEPDTDKPTPRTVKKSAPPNPDAVAAVKAMTPVRYAAGTGSHLKLDYFPMGVYCPGTFGSFKDAAQAEKVEPLTIADRMYAEIRELGCNTVYFQGTNLHDTNGHTGAVIAGLAAKHGLRVIGQMNDVYFRQDNSRVIQGRFKTGWDYYRRYLAPRVKKHLPHYTKNRHVWCWSPVEELHHRYVWEMAAYRRLIWDICPNHLIYELVTDLQTMKTMKPPLPNFVGVDRYCFWHQGRGRNLTMWTPQYALRWLRAVIRPFIAEAARNGKPCVFVMQGAAVYEFRDPFPWLKTKARKQAYLLPDAPTLEYYADLDRFGCWGMYLPPQNAMRAMCWIGVLEGARGLFMWPYGYHYGDPDARAAKARRAGQRFAIRIGRTVPQWKDLQRGFAEVAPFAKLLMALSRDRKSQATTDDKDVWASTFADGDGNRFVVVVNSRIAHWDGDSPRHLNHPKTKLTIDSRGQLTGYDAAPPKRFTLTVTGDLHALRAQTKLRSTGPGRYEMTLEPGQGTVLHWGDRSRLARARQQYGL